jgi:hypothetical protein
VLISKKYKQLKFAIIFDAVKRLLSILFIFLLSAQCIFKLSIIAYFETHREYIAEVLCINKEKKITVCYGQCFLDRNFAIGDEGSDEPTTTTNKLQVETTIFLEMNFDWHSNERLRPQVKFDARELIYSYDLTHTLFHPPC